MNLKTKIRKVSPYWFIFLSVIISTQNFVFLAERNGQQKEIQKNIIDSKVPQQQVLGAFTNIRGQIQASSTQPEVSPNLNLKLNDLSAKSFLVYDLLSDRVLAEKDSFNKLPIASLTKLLTALVVYEKTDLNSSITIESRDVLNIKPSLNLLIGDSIKVQDLLAAMLVGSCNDAALALSNHVSEITGKSFIELMNKKAEDLGMSDSLFSNPIGFDIKQNYSTAQDLKKLISATQHLGVFKNFSKLTGYKFISDSGKQYKTLATNKLIGKYDDLQAIKTGFTESAQGSMITKLRLNQNQIILIVIGSLDREKDTLEIRKQLIENFE